MNYKKQDEERIRRQKEAQAKYRQSISVKQNTSNRNVYSKQALEKLANGGYKNRVPELKKTQNTVSQNNVPKTSAPTVSNNQVKPSTRYQNQNVTKSVEQPKQTKRDTRYDKDFDNFFNYRYGDFSGEVDYDPKTDTDVESWRNVKRDIMSKNNWTDKEFEDRFKEYSDERYKKTGNDIIAASVEAAKKHPILGTIQQAVLNPGVWIEGAANMLSGLIPGTHKAQSAEDPLFLSSRQKDAIKQTVKDEHIKSGVGKAAYDIGTSIGDMAMSAGLPVLGTAALGTETASRTQRQALERGVDPTKAALTGLGAGTISGVLNKVGLDKAVNTTAKTALGGVLKAAGIEGAENVTEDTANLLIDTLMNKDKAQLNAMHDYYKSQGMTDDEAWNRVTLGTLGELGISALSGAAFGGAMNGVRNIPALGQELKELSLNNKGMADIDELASKNPDIQAILRSKPEDIDEATLESYKAKKKDVDAQLRQKNKEIKAQEEVHKNADKKTRDAEYQKLDALRKEAEALQLEKKIYNYAAKGQAVPVKDQLKPDVHKSIYDTRTGLFADINYAQKFAGDTDEAKQLAKETKDLMNRYIESGSLDDYEAAMIKAGELDGLARAVNNEYKSGRYSYNYGDYFLDEDGQAGTLIDRLVGSSSLTNGVQAVHKGRQSVADTEPIANDGKLTPEEVAKLQEVVDGKYDIPENGNLPNSTKIPEYTMGEDVYFRGSDDDIVRAESQDKAIVDTFKNIIADPEFNALSFKNGSKEVFVSPATNGNGLRMSYTIDGVPTGHHDYSLDQLDELSRNLRNEAGNGGEDIKIQRKSDMAKRAVPELSNGNEPPRRSFFDDLPPRSDKEGKSKVGTNTMVNSKIFTKDQIDNDPVISELNKYAKANNDQTFNAAKEDVLRNGDTLLNDYINGTRLIKDDRDVDSAMLLLKGLNDKISYGDTSLEAQRNLLFSKLRQTGTLYGQTIQAFKKWNDTPEGAVINGERLLDKPTEQWKSKNKKQVAANSRIAKALEQMGYDGSMDKEPTVKTREQVKEGVLKAIEREYGSIEGLFNDEDIDFLTDLAMDKTVPIWQITDEIEHKLNHGEWYEIEPEVKEPPKPINQKLKNALDALVPREKVEKEPPTIEELREQVRNTLDREMAGINDFSDRDIDYLANLINEGAKKDELAQALDTRMATGKFGIELDTQRKVNELFEYANQFDPDSKNAIEAKTAAYKLIADEVLTDKASPLEKFESWRYLAMLGNPKTMVRNLIGNKMFGTVTGVSNNLSAMIEAGTDKLAKKLGADGIQRTKAVLNPVDDRGLIQAAANDGDAHRYSELEGTKYEKGTTDAIKKQKSVFNSKLIRLYERATDAGVSDYKAVKKKYSTSLAGYMKANGLDESAFDADDTYRKLLNESKRRVLTDSERAQMESSKDIHDQLEKARDYAVKQAEYATFHEPNVIASMLTRGTQALRKGDIKINGKTYHSNVAQGLGYALEGMLPFKKTPANILRSGAEYSPLNAINSVWHTGKLIYENTGKRKGNLDDVYLNKKGREVEKSLAADVIDSWSKTLTGSALVWLGYFLKNHGILNSSNKDEKWQDDLEGIQNYSITINGKTYTLDWAAPAVMPLLMGAEISKIKDRSVMLDQKWYENADAIGETINALLDPMFETSMLSGIKDTIEESAKQLQYNENGAVGGVLGSIAMNTATGYATQGIPTFLGQIARTVDNTRRTTDTATQSAMLAPVEKQARKIINKIPGLSRINQPYYDAYGRTQSNSPTNNPIFNLAYQMGMPSYIRDINTTDADRQARDVYYGVGEDGKPIMDSKVFPAWKSTVKVSGEKFSPSEMASYRKTSGEAQYAIRDALTKEEWFNNLDASQQTELLKKVNTLVDKIGKDSVDKLDSSSKDFEAYQNGGIPSLFDYWRGNAASQQARDMGVNTDTNAGKEIAQLIQDGKTEEATAKAQEVNAHQQKMEAINQKYGTDMSLSNYLKYESTYEGGAEQWAKNRQAAEAAGIVNSAGQVLTKDYAKIMSQAGSQSAKMERDLPTLNGMGMPKSSYYTYAQAINVNPGLSPNEFAKTFNEIDTEHPSGKRSITQDEMLAYFNKHHFTSEDQAMYYWSMYAPEGKKVPYLKSDGTWGKH